MVFLCRPVPVFDTDIQEPHLEEPLLESSVTAGTGEYLYIHITRNIFSLKYKYSKVCLFGCCLFAVTVSGVRGDRHVSLPPTVGTRRKRCSESVRRRSARFDSTSVEKCVTYVSEPSRSEKKQEVSDDIRQGGELSIPLGDIRNEAEERNGELRFVGPDSKTCVPDNLNTDLDTEPPEIKHSTPEPPQRTTRRPKRKNTQAAPRIKPERGRKPDRAPLKKPWENSKPRARSKSRDRSQSRARVALTPGDRLNSSLGGNDTFDFDCEEAVHLTPFRAGNKPVEKPSPDAPVAEEVQLDPAVETNNSLSEGDQDADDSLYMPKSKSRKACSPPPRRARSKRRSIQEARKNRGKENISLKRAESKHTGKHTKFRFHSMNIFGIVFYYFSLFLKKNTGLKLQILAYIVQTLFTRALYQNHQFVFFLQMSASQIQAKRLADVMFFRCEQRF